MLKKQQTYEELQESIMRYHKCNIKLNFQNQKLHNKIASLENQIQTLQASTDQSKLLLADVSHCGLTEIEYTERELLIELQRSATRWFSQQEFNRLKQLSNKMFKNAGSPHCG